MIQALQEEISAVVGGLPALVNEFRWRLGENHRPAILFFFFIQFLDVLPGPFIGILSIQFFPEFRLGAQFFNDFGSIGLGFGIIYGLNNIQRSCVLGLGHIQSHLKSPPCIYIITHCDKMRYNISKKT